MKAKIITIALAALMVTAPAYAVLFDVYNLPRDGELPVWCPPGYSPRITHENWYQKERGRRGLVYCVIPATLTPVPPLMSPLSPAAPTPSLPTMPKQ